MKKKLLATSAALMITLSGISVPAFSLNTHTVSAATTATPNPYNNQTAVNAKADNIIATAKYLIGKATYATGTANSSLYQFRCASFVNFVFKQNGINLANADENYMFQQGYAVPRDQLQKGDLVFFDSTPTNSDPTNHVGIYIGDNKIIHMANTKLNVTISDLNSTSYYRDSYVGARRVLPSLLSANPATKGDKVVETAFNSIGNGLTGVSYFKRVFQDNGIKLSGTTRKSMMTLGTKVAKEDLKKGDLVFFGTNSSYPSIMGIYAGDHRIIVSTSTGVSAKIMFSSYYRDNYITAKRVF